MDGLDEQIKSVFKTCLTARLCSADLQRFLNGKRQTHITELSIVSSSNKVNTFQNESVETVFVTVSHSFGDINCNI